MYECCQSTASTNNGEKRPKMEPDTTSNAETPTEWLVSLAMECSM